MHRSVEPNLYHVHAWCLEKSEVCVGFPGTVVADGYQLPRKYPGSLQEQQVPLAVEPSLQLLFSFFFWDDISHPRVATNSRQSFCHSFPSAGIIGVIVTTWSFPTTLKFRLMVLSTEKSGEIQQITLHLFILVSHWWPLKTWAKEEWIEHPSPMAARRHCT